MLSKQTWALPGREPQVWIQREEQQNRDPPWAKLLQGSSSICLVLIPLSSSFTYMNNGWRITGGKKKRQWVSPLKRGKKPKEQKREEKTSGIWKRKLSRRRNTGDCQRMDISLLPTHSPQEVGMLQEGAGRLWAPHPAPEPGLKQRLCWTMRNDWLYGMKC